MVFKPNYCVERRVARPTKGSEKRRQIEAAATRCVVAAGQQLNGEIMRRWRWDQIGDPVDLIEHDLVAGAVTQTQRWQDVPVSRARPTRPSS
jgi:hypothetical protein